MNKQTNRKEYFIKEVYDDSKEVDHLEKFKY